MADDRRMAADPPQRSASSSPGAHLLGRIYTPDARDWSMGKLRELAEPSDAILTQTVQQVIDSKTYFSDWRSYLVFWHWLNKKKKPVKKDPGGWALNVQLDQGQTNHCVGFGWAGWGDAAPVVDAFQNADANAIYYECKVIDGQPHGENGSSVRSGALAMRARGRLAAFAFATTTAEIDDWIDNHGPVVMGTNWTNDMFNPDANGFIKPTGGVAGGHCYLMLDRLPAEDGYLFQNSWGSNWGLNGRFKIKTADLASLLAAQGEACCTAELP